MKKGFTLIELLVVIAIIGVLSSIVMSSISSARKKARDNQRISNFREFRTALDMYYTSHGSYPPTPPCTIPSCSWEDHKNIFNAIGAVLVSEGLISSIPKDPNDPASFYMAYDYGHGSEAGYIIVATLESIKATTVPPYGSCRPFDINWCSYTTASTYYCVCNTY